MDAFNADDDEASVDSEEYACLGKAAPAETAEDSEGAGVFVAALLTSHVGDRRQISSLQTAWESLLAQDDKPDHALLSMSYRPDLIEDVDNLRKDALANAAAAGVPASVMLRDDSAIKPMVHLRSLVQDLLSSRGGDGGEQLDMQRWWVIFGDDSDIWHPARTKSYRKACRVSRDARVLLASVRCRQDSSSEIARSPCSIADVEKLLELGDVVLEGEGRAPEYFDYTVRLDLLRDFYARVPDPLLHIKYADMALVAFLESIGPKRQAVIPIGGCWMYYYMERPQPALATGSAQLTTKANFLLPADRDRARGQLADLAIAQPGLTLDDLAVAVAHCREWIEGLAANMWIGGPYTSGGLQLLSRSALRNAPPAIDRREGQEALSDWSLQEVRERFLPRCEELGLLQAG